MIALGSRATASAVAVLSLLLIITPSVDSTLLSLRYREHTALAATTAATAAGLPTQAELFADFKCEQRNFTQKLDHFETANTATFNQRMYVCPGAWPATPEAQAANGSIIFFLGNESPLTNISQPIVFENARRKNALIIELEHRYYGASSPFTPNATSGMLTPEQYKFLTVEQVMADSKAALESVRQELEVPKEVPTVVIGGSYGGMIASYHRFTYPDTFDAAIAASAPVNYVVGTQMIDDTEEQFHDVITEAVDGATGSTNCSTAVRAGLDQVAAIREANATARIAVAKALGVCKPETAVPDVHAALALLQNYYDYWVGAVQLNDQVPDPGQIKKLCAAVQGVLKKTPGNYLAALSAAARVQEDLPDNECIDFNGAYAFISPPVNDSTSAAYDWQCCSQGTTYSSFLTSTGEGTLVPPLEFTDADIRKECVKTFGPTVPDFVAPKVALEWDQKLSDIGQVVFTNGDRDGWAGGSIFEAPPGTKAAFVVYPNASHCTDTHSYNWGAKEPAEYKVLRAQAMDEAAVWMEEGRAIRNGTRPVPSGASRWVLGHVEALALALVALMLA